MYVIIRIIIVLTLLNFLFLKCLTAQPSVVVYTDIGENNVSEGLFLKTAGLAKYQLDKYIFEAGFQFAPIHNYSPFFSGFNGKVSRQIQLKKLPFEIQLFYIYSPFSENLRETNGGALVNVKRNHFNFKLGTNFRTFAYNKSAVKKYEFSDNNKIHENWNLIYLIEYYIKPLTNFWNIGLTVTNLDHFTISQETNPIIYLRGQYNKNLPVEIFMETWYKSSGVFNLSVNYFGFFVRTGIVWEIN